MALALVFVSGLLFAVGLGISGMTQPEKVSSFLNVMGDWDPSLALVMLGASVTYFVGRKIIAFQNTKQLLPSNTHGNGKRIDKSLVGGSALFGLGWGTTPSVGKVYIVARKRPEPRQNLERKPRGLVFFWKGL